MGFATLVYFLAVLILFPETTICQDAPSEPTSEDSEASGLRAKFSGGIPAAEGRYPYVVSLINDGNSHFCGGVLVSRLLLITTAECAWRSARPTVHIGGDGLYNPKEVRKVVDVFVHPEWNGDRRQGHNIAILKMDARTSIDPIRIPKSYIQLQDRESLFGLGWGRSSSSGSFTDSLQVATLPFVVTWKCNRLGLMGGAVHPNYICAGGQGAGMCEGDEGAPLIRFGGNKSQDLLVGLAMLSSGRCGQTRRPDIYVRVDSFNSWIARQIGYHDQP